MKVLVVGSGGREHALCWALAASPLCRRLFCAPGNAGIAEEAECVPVRADDLDGLVGFAAGNAIDLVVVGPEAPLVAGLVDRLEAKGIRAFGPSARAAALEGSKGFMKDLCARHGIPTAAYRRFRDAAAAKAHVRARGAPVVVKADGLAAGKGVVVAESEAEAVAAIEAMMRDRAFGEAGAEVVIEDRLEGEEASFLALVDGRTALPLASAQDHKAIGDGDTGPNTGGMGAYSPAPVVDEAMAARVMDTIIRPTVAAMAAEGRPYKGVLYAGLMITPDGPKVLEFNVRFGDPECQVLVLRMMSDLLPALIAACDGALAHLDFRWRPEAALLVVMAARGYPGAYRTGTEIRGPERARALPGVTLFHAGTRAEGGRLLAQGGRVLGVGATAPTIAEAKERAYAAVRAIDWPDGYWRTDIGWRAIGR
ncbi:MAG: phosphoribosylamine--glycine ligase [Proteobacteria bacterium]|nr:phosphoribosylamine--glycine ligase [Pseudomonadota bacterium]